jgi:hypothetical protein
VRRHVQNTRRAQVMNFSPADVWIFIPEGKYLGSELVSVSRYHLMATQEKSIFYIVLILALTLGAASCFAQPKVRLVRTNKQSTPWKFQIYGGYNGMSTPDDKLQDMFEETDLTNWGGFMGGVKALITIDTIGLPFMAGINLYTHRTMKRSLYDAHGVHYSDSNDPVNAIETVSSYGIEGLISYGPFARISLELGGGSQYVNPSVDHPSNVIGLFKPVWLPTAMVAVNYIMLKYDHGSMDANIRFLKTFGAYHNFQLQSLFCFTFNL